MPDNQTQQRSHSYDKDATVLLASIVKSPTLNFDAFCKALDANADPNWRDNSGTPLLHLLARKGNAPAIEAAIEAGAEVNGTDTHGNTAIFEAYLEQPMMALLLAGADPHHRNTAGIMANTHLPREHTGLAYRQMVVSTAHLLENCQEIAMAAKHGALGPNTYNNLWPNNSFGYPPPTSRVPEKACLSYFLHKMEEAGKFMPKSSLQSGNTSASMGLRKSISESEQTAIRWRDHCDKAGEPMTGEDWQATTIFSQMSKDHRIACLFTSDYWAGKESLEGFVDLFNALPSHVFEQSSRRLHQTVGDTLHEWLTHGGGKDLNRQEIRAFRDAMPEKMREMFPSYHVLQYERGSQQQSHANGR